MKAVYFACLCSFFNLLVTGQSQMPYRSKYFSSTAQGNPIKATSPINLDLLPIKWDNCCDEDCIKRCMKILGSREKCKSSNCPKLNTSMIPSKQVKSQTPRRKRRKISRTKRKLRKKSVKGNVNKNKIRRQIKRDENVIRKRRKLSIPKKKLNMNVAETKVDYQKPPPSYYVDFTRHKK